MIGQAIRDLRHASRMILRMPALAAVVIGSLGVGIGANTIVFSWIQAVVVNPIRGVRMASGFQLIEPKTDAGMYLGASWPEYRDLRERLRALDGLIAFRMIPLYVGESGRVERSSALLVSDNYFSALGLTPALGRFLRTDEVEKPGTAPVVVISHDYWQTRFGGAAGALGQTIRVNGADVTIVGVAPRGVQGHDHRAHVRLLAAGDDGAGAAAAVRTSSTIAASAATPSPARSRARRRARPGAERRRRRDAAARAGLSADQPQRRGGRAAVLAIAARAAAADGDLARHPADPDAAAAAGGVRQHREPRAGAGQRAAAGNGRSGSRSAPDRGASPACC